MDRPSRIPGWSIGPLLLGATALGGWIVSTRPDWLLGAVLTTLVGAGILWVVVSAFTPAQADRTCPSCGGEGLERLDPASTTGVTCRACGFEDPAASGWFLAEDEVASLEELVLDARTKRRSNRSPHGSGS